MWNWNLSWEKIPLKAWLGRWFFTWPRHYYQLIMPAEGALCAGQISSRKHKDRHKDGRMRTEERWDNRTSSRFKNSRLTGPADIGGNVLKCDLWYANEVVEIWTISCFEEINFSNICRNFRFRKAINHTCSTQRVIPDERNQRDTDLWTPDGFSLSGWLKMTANLSSRLRYCDRTRPE